MKMQDFNSCSYHDCWFLLQKILKIKIDFIFLAFTITKTSRMSASYKSSAFNLFMLNGAMKDMAIEQLTKSNDNFPIPISKKMCVLEMMQAMWYNMDDDQRSPFIEEAERAKNGTDVKSSL